MIEKSLIWGALPWEADGGAVVAYYLYRMLNYLNPDHEFYGIPKVPAALSGEALPFMQFKTFEYKRGLARANKHLFKQIPEFMCKNEIPLLTMWHIPWEFFPMTNAVREIGGKTLIHQTIHWKTDLLFKSKILGDVDAWVAPTRWAEEQLRLVGRIKRDRIKYLPHAINVEKFYPHDTAYRKNLNLKPNQKVILVVGRCSLAKGLHQVIPIMRHIIRDYDAIFIIKAGVFPQIAKSEEIAYIVKMMGENNSNIIWLPDWTPPEVMEELIASCDILLQPCHDENTRALTDNGLKYISDINMEDKVWTLNKNKELELNKIKNIFVNNYKGEMFRIKNKQISLFVTPKHEILYTTRKKPNNLQKRKVKDLKKSTYYLPTTGIWKGLDIDYIDAKSLVNMNLFNSANKLPEILHTEPLLRLLGWYISEGSIYQEKEISNPNRVIIYNSDENNKKEICKLIKQLKLHPIVNKECVIVYSMELAKIFSSAGIGAKNKNIPKWALQFSRRLLLGLYDSMIKGDGSRKGNYSATYYTSSDYLLESFLELVLKIGYSPKFYKRITKQRKSKNKIFPQTESWAISIREKYNKGTMLSNSRNKIKYEGITWCLETENGNFFTEKDGLLTCSGNSGHEGFDVPLIEAMACKKAIAVTNIPNHYEIMGSRNRYCGLFMEPSVVAEVLNDGKQEVKVPSTDMIDGSLRFLLENPEECEAYGDNGYTRVRRNYNLAKVGSMWLDYMDELFPEDYEMSVK